MVTNYTIPKPLPEDYSAAHTKMRILVTGSSGFIASKMVQKLRELGHDVFPFDIADGHDILNLHQITEAVKNVDVVYHIAAQADLTQMSRSVEDGYRGARINIEGTHNVAFACASQKKWLIYASTVCTYGNLTDEQHGEDGAHPDTTLPNPSELYACSKYAGEWIVKGYGLNTGMPYTILRFATIYGEGMRPALGLHIFFRQAMKGEDITVHGDGTQDRTLTFINDLVDGIVAPLSHQETAKNQVFNLSAKETISANKMAEDVKALVESDSNIVHIDQRDNQTLHEDFDVRKTKELLGWEAATSWKDGLQETYNWMKTQI